ncbi:Transcriptional regulator, TetR family [Alloactinosynnema sp. L-07]|uniref:TetR/AcrR family transcriptional regulator n=1 Tax=Alloactinosynnema sp. L-07 TaxID=1653480 RepID=UPI00065EFDFF|nr:TetR/AcrR family transcriptional regulator [Alloactinosynnema sp. L-07]CRK55866.1 Transcriptional regulator, TetR family [Alloactinosynnema sp. L-07]
MTTKTPGARDRNRAALTLAIKEDARDQLATAGAQALSLRAVARNLGMSSSAVYRYYPCRDDLLTALIIDAYTSLADAVERADHQGTPRERWLDIWRAVRAWALANRHEYALIYGSPVPGYKAPQDTIAPAGRVPLLLLTIARAAEVADAEIDTTLRGQLAAVADAISIDLPPGAFARVMVAWTQLFGVVGFELFGQLVGSADPADALFDFSAAAMADFVGL